MVGSRIISSCSATSRHQIPHFLKLIAGALVAQDTFLKLKMRATKDKTSTWVLTSGLTVHTVGIQVNQETVQ